MAYEYRIDPDNACVVQVRRYRHWRLYMRCVSAEYARHILDKLTGREPEPEVLP